MARPARLVLALACLLAFVLLSAQVLLHGPMLDVDNSITAWWGAHRRPWLTEGMLLVSQVHEQVPVLLAAGCVMLWCGRRRDWSGVRCLAGVPTAMVLNVALKDSFRRARPVVEDPLVRLATYS